MSAFRRESPDVTLGSEFLEDYKSFCWQGNETQGLLCLPRVYIGGFPKCGTSDLHSKMLVHPLIDTGKYKEYQWWTIKRFQGQSFLQYLKNLRPEGGVKPGTVLLDSSTTLGWFQFNWKVRYPELEEPPYYNADIIKHLTPDAKIIFMVRNPTERLWSDYLYFSHDRANGPGYPATPDSFDNAARRTVEQFNSCLHQKTLKKCCYDRSRGRRLNQAVVELGIYVCFIPLWKDKFGNNLKVVTMEEYSSDPLSTMVDLFNFMEVPLRGESLISYQDEINGMKLKNTRKPEDSSKGDMLNSTRKVLDDFYREYNEAFSLAMNDTNLAYYRH